MNYPGCYDVAASRRRERLCGLIPGEKGEVMVKRNRTFCTNTFWKKRLETRTNGLNITYAERDNMLEFDGSNTYTNSNHTSVLEGGGKNANVCVLKQTSTKLNQRCGVHKYHRVFLMLPI